MSEDTEFSNKKENYLRISEPFRKNCLNKGLKSPQILLLAELIWYSKKNTEITALNYYLAKEFRVCEKTITRYLKILSDKGFISMHYKKLSINGLVRTDREIQVIIWDKKSHKKLYKHSKAIASNTETKTKDIKTKSMEKLTTIFKTKSEEIGLHISREDLRFEALKFDSYFSQKGFQRYTSIDGKKFVYKAVGDWILWDKYGIFHQKIEQKKEFEKSEIRFSQKQKENEKQKKSCLMYQKLDEFYISKTTENYKKYHNIKEDDIILEMRQVFRKDPLLEGYLHQLEANL